MALCADWIVEADLDDCHTDAAAASATIKAQAITAASEILYSLSGSKWPGVCEETIRPCMNMGSSWFAAMWPSAYSWWPADWPTPPAACQCSSGGGCGCGDVPQISLGRDDVTEVTDVTINGVMLAGTSYRLDEQYWLVRTDGSGWPCCQNLANDPGEADTWTVTFSYGAEPPEAGKLAATSLAAELILGCVGSSDCRIPNRATTVTREGVTYALLDPQPFLEQRRTGLYEVDLWLAAVNPASNVRRARIFSPDLAAARRVAP
jgi:hypothetical protein